MIIQQNFLKTFDFPGLDLSRVSVQISHPFPQVVKLLDQPLSENSHENYFLLTFFNNTCSGVISFGAKYFTLVLKTV